MRFTMFMLFTLCFLFLSFSNAFSSSSSSSSLSFSSSIAIESLQRYRADVLEKLNDKPSNSLNVGWVPGENKFTIQRPEGARTYYVYIPKNYNGSIPLSFHISLHGLGDTCTNFGRGVGFTDYVDQYGDFIYAYPCGYSGLLGNGWNAGTCCLSTYDIDDVALVRAIVANAQSLWNIDPKRIFASGFSNGAMMSEVLACEANDLFRAVASVSGVVELKPGNEKGLAQCDQDFLIIGKNISVINIHGTNDPLVPYKGDVLLGFPDIQEDMSRWAQRNGCSQSTHQTFSKGTFANIIYDNCPGDVRIELVTNTGGGHIWPSTTNFDTTKYIYEFFKSFH